VIPQPTRAFTKAVSKLDRSEQILVLKTVERLKQTENEIGKPLTGDLHHCRSIRTGSAGRLRIVFRTETRQVLRLLVVGPRERGIVYIQAVQVIKQLEQ
jgi:mRNA-degrading endonuclease RelE of RelBE toxin-antitoxin system